MNADQIISKLQMIKTHLQREYALKTLGVFGLFSDGTYNDDSDADILVEFERPVGWSFFKLEKHLEDTLKRKIDLVTVNALTEQVKQAALRQIHYV